MKLIALFLVAISGQSDVFGQAPVSNFTGTPLSGCSPLIVSFQDLSTGTPVSWNWSFGNGNTSTIQNPTATYFTPGTYTVILTTTNASGSNMLTRTNYITVYDNPTVNFSANVTSGCFPLKVQFTDMSSPGVGNTNVSWEWDFGNGTTSTVQNPLATYTTAGLFNVTLKVTNDKGCTRTLSRPNYIAVTSGVDASFTNPQPTVCTAPATITFTNTSSGPPTLSYLWDFGDGSPLSTVFSPTHTYSTNGNFIVRLITTSTAGCEDTAWSIPVVVGGLSPSFTWPPTICINKVASFANTSTPLPINSSWNFGDGSPMLTGFTTSHTYTTAGTYTVWMYNNYTGCLDSISQIITVLPNPIADFTAPVTSRCEPPLTVNFQDISTGGAVGWEWDFGDGSPVSLVQNPSHTYTTYGNFNVRLIITSASGCIDTIIKPAYINVQRTIITIPNLPDRGCIPFTITPVPAITSFDPIASYEWDFGDGSPAVFGPGPSHTYPLQGTYTVRLIVTTSTGCRDTLIIPSAVRTGSKPIANFTGPNEFCATELVPFTDLSTPATVDEWAWTFGDGGGSIIKNPFHSYNDTGYFTVRLIATNNGCPDTITKINFLHISPPIARFTTAIVSCANRVRFSFNNQSIINPLTAPLTWEWNFGDGSPVSTIQNPAPHSYPGLGVYTVRLIVNNGTCFDTAYQTVRIIDEAPDFTADQIAACKIANITFNAINLNFANIVSYNWDFGDATSVNTIIPTTSHIYINSGNYTIRLITTDLNGCTDTIIKPNYLRINGPIAGFTATNTGGCTGLTTTFNNTSIPDGVNAIVNWQWNFGDGNIQNFSTPPFQHTYNTTGVFSVQLIITDAAGCKDSITVNNLINATDPVPNFVSADTLACPLSIVTFTNTSVPAGVTSSWDFGDGGTSLITSPTYSYAATGVYNVRLAIEDAFGCRDTIIKAAYIRVDEPNASFTVDDSVSSCTPLEVQFTNTSTYYKSVVWDFGPGEGNSTLNNPVHFYSVPGVYMVKLLVTSPGGCLDSAFHTITVYDTAGSTVNYLPLGGCKPLNVNLNILTPGPMASYYWDFGDGITQTTTVPNINHTYSSFGNFLPKVIMEDPTGCLIPLQGIDTVYVTGAKANFGNDDSLFCDFGLVNFTDSTTFNDPVLSYNWNFGDGGTSPLQHPSHLYTSPGIYTVRLAVQTQLGCLDTLIKTNIVKVVQRPLIDITGDSVLCINSSLVHSGIFLIPDTSVVTWSWNFPNGNTSTLQNPVAQTYSTAGSFTVTAYATNSTGCKDTTTQSLLVNPLPTATIPNTITINAGFPVMIPATYAPTVNTWLWSPATGLSCTNCSNPNAGPNFNTFYQVAYTDVNGCTNFGSILVQVLCQNSNLFIPNTFSPNGDGSNDKFYPRGVGLDRVKVMRIFNRWGEVVFEKRDFPINDANAGWDGTYKGQKPQADVYIFQAEVFCQNGQIIKLNGNISLIL